MFSAAVRSNVALIISAAYGATLPHNRSSHGQAHSGCASPVTANSVEADGLVLFAIHEHDKPQIVVFVRAVEAKERISHSYIQVVWLSERCSRVIGQSLLAGRGDAIYCIVLPADLHVILRVVKGAMVSLSENG